MAHISEAINNLPTGATPPTGPTPPTQQPGPPCSRPSDWYGLDLDWHPDLHAAARAVTEWYGAEWGALVLSGGYGCGKTHISKVVLTLSGGPRSYLEWNEDGVKSVHNALFYAEPDLLEDLRQSYNGFSKSEHSIIRTCQRARLLILDDLGAAYVKEESSRWYEDLIWRILDPRAKLKTLITTNLTPPEVRRRVGGRGYSRLQEMLNGSENYINLFGVPDYRAKDW